MTTLLDKLEKRFGNYAIPNLTLFLLIGQIGVWLLLISGRLPLSVLVLSPEAVIQGGQWWRVVSFVFVPPVVVMNLWAVLAFYIFYIWGSKLEGALGSFRYNCFILCAVVLTAVFALLASFFVPAQGGFPASNVYILASIFLACAILNPNYEALLFFILPLKLKWLGWLTVVFWVLALLGGPAYTRTSVLASAVTVALFFARGWYISRKYRRRAEAYHAENRALAAEPFHRCCVCNVTDNDEPDLRFAYKDGKGYCERHWDEMES